MVLSSIVSNPNSTSTVSNVTELILVILELFSTEHGWWCYWWIHVHPGLMFRCSCISLCINLERSFISLLRFPINRVADRLSVQIPVWQWVVVVFAFHPQEDSSTYKREQCGLTTLACAPPTLFPVDFNRLACRNVCLWWTSSAFHFSL